MRQIKIPVGQIIEDRSFIVDYVGQNTGRLVEKVILDGTTEIEYTGDEREKGLRTILVKNDVRPSADSSTLNITLNISKKTQRKVNIKLKGNYEIEVNWGDGYVQAISGDGETVVEHTYSQDVVNRMSISGSAEDINVSSDSIVIVSSFGKLGLNKIDFSNCTNLIKIPESLPESVIDLSYCFSNCHRIDTGNLSLWDFSHVIDLTGFLSFAEDKLVSFSNMTLEKLESIDKFFYNSTRCTLQFNNCKLPSLKYMDGVFEAANTPTFLISEVKMPDLTTLKNVFLEAYTVTENRGLFKITDSILGMTVVENLIYDCSGIDVIFENLSFPNAISARQLAVDIIDTDIKIDNLTFGVETSVTRLFSNVNASVSNKRSSIFVLGNTLGKITDFYRLIDNVSDTDIVFNFKQFSQETLIDNFTGMLFSLSKVDINLNNVDISTIDITEMVENSNDVMFKMNLTIAEPIVFTRIATDSDRITIDLSNSLFRDTVEYRTLCPGAKEVKLIETKVTYEKDVTYSRVLQSHEVICYEAIDNIYRENVYIDALVDDCGVDEIYANNWKIFKDLTLICLFKRTELINQFKEITLNGWYIAGNLNSKTLSRYKLETEGYLVRWFKKCRIDLVSMRNWTIDKVSNLESNCSDISGINKLDLENWTVNDINMNFTFSNCGANISLKRWDFRKDVILQNTFSSNVNYNRTIDLSGVLFSAKVSFLETFKNSNVNINLLSMKFREQTVFRNTFEYLGSSPAGKDIEILITGLASLNVDNVVLIDSFMIGLGREVKVNGLEGLMLWNLNSGTLVITPFTNTTLPFDPPF